MNPHEPTDWTVAEAPQMLEDGTPSRAAKGAFAPACDARKSRPLPEDAVVILPVRNMVLFPGAVVPLALGRARSRAAAEQAARAKRPLGVLLQREGGAHEPNEEPGPDDLHWVGTTADVVRSVTAPGGTQHIICQGVERFRVLEFVDGYDFLVARVQRIEDSAQVDKEIEARALMLKQRAIEILHLLPQEMPQEVLNSLQSIESPSQLADLVAALVDVSVEEKQSLLEAFNLRTRLDRLLDILSRRAEVLRISHEIDQRTKKSIGEKGREHLLREQLRTIQNELGEGGESAAELEEVEKAIREAGMPEDVEKQALKELKRLQRMPEGAGEQSMVRTYLDWLTELPWKKPEVFAINIAEARRTLDHDHHGLDKIKKRILEYLAVRKLNPDGKAPILCFVGPPGVGKTSLGQSIARATGREFVRVSLGGVHDEAEIRGHRRTYIGALPGNIIQGMKKAGTRNVVMMLDEVDKLGAGGFHGDPSSALLEVLDPEQNGTFRDNYLALPYDLSSVLFVCTANVLDTIPGPLRDRMEVIQLPGYTANEKLKIAQGYLLERQLSRNGLKVEHCEITEAALVSIIEDYTREAGVRNLEREIGSVCRNVALRIAEVSNEVSNEVANEGNVERIVVDAADLATILGAHRFEAEIAMRTAVPGVATGLAWTPVGGDILFIEAARMPGSGKLIVTGQLGDVMKESVQAALSLVKGRAVELGIDPELLDKSDIHIHVPAGATPKDGPSAGVAMFTALSSLLTQRPLRSDVAMTGEISLRGLVLPIGGVKEKVLAALRAGIKTVMLPARNRRDLEDIPAEAREKLEFVWLEHVDDALKVALSQVATP